MIDFNINLNISKQLFRERGRNLLHKISLRFLETIFRNSTISEENWQLFC